MKKPSGMTCPKHTIPCVQVLWKDISAALYGDSLRMRNGRTSPLIGFTSVISLLLVSWKFPSLKHLTLAKTLTLRQIRRSMRTHMLMAGLLGET